MERHGFYFVSLVLVVICLLALVWIGFILQFVFLEVLRRGGENFKTGRGGREFIVRNLCDDLTTTICISIL